MPVFRWGSTFDAFRDLEREMDRWVRSMDSAFEGVRVGRPFPAVNLYELEDEYLLTAELPGCEPQDLEVTVVNGVLTLKGTRCASEIPAERFRRSERAIGNWERSVSLPDRVNDADISAEFTDGLLKLHLPKHPHSAPRQIQVMTHPALEAQPPTEENQ